MIDYFTLALTHGLILTALWRLVFRADLDEDGEVATSRAKPAKRGSDRSGRDA